MKKYVIILTAIFCFFTLTCAKDKSVSPNLHDLENESKIKRKLLFHSIEDANPHRVYEYKYDEDWKLLEIFEYWENSDKPIGHEIFEYSINDKIINKSNYNYANDSTGCVLRDSTYYHYENGKLINENIYYSPSEDCECFFYEYSDSKLIKSSRYYNDKLDYYVNYDYEQNFCSKESYYSENEELIQYIVHNYANDFLMQSEYYNSKSELFRMINYTYDENGNLVIEESIIILYEYVKPMDYVIRYEYY